MPRLDKGKGLTDITSPRRAMAWRKRIWWRQSRPAKTKKVNGSVKPGAPARWRSSRASLPARLAGSAAAAGRYEWLRGRHSQAKGWWQRSLRETEAMGCLTTKACSTWKWATAGERAHLEKAAEIFTAIGAEYDLAKARGALERMKR